jgi:TRAP-type C4-dicarboxylate transport system substrate-binding protein
MKKNLTKVIALVLILALSLSMFTACGGGGNDGGSDQGAGEEAVQDPVTLHWAFTPPAESADDVWHQKVGKLVEEYTDGLVKYEFYPGGTLGNEKVALEGVISGTIHQASISPNVVATVLPEFNVLCLPFVFDSVEHFFDVISTDEYYNKMNEAANKVGLQYLGEDFITPRNISTKKPVYTPADADKQVLRVMDGTIYTDMMEMWGFNSAVISYGEVYTSIQQGVVDGVENSNNGNYVMKFHEVIDYSTNTNHVFHGQACFMNLDLWNSLTQETRDAIQKAWKDIYPIAKAELAGLPEYDTQMVKDAGVTVIELNDEQKQAWIEASQPLYDKYRGVIGEEFYDFAMELIDSKRQ